VTRVARGETSACTPPSRPHKHEAKAVLTHQFHGRVTWPDRFAFDDFATIEDDKLTLKRDDKIALPPR